jgi:hypothetical protein
LLVFYPYQLLQAKQLQIDNDMLLKQVESLTLEKADMLRQIQVREAAGHSQATWRSVRAAW